MAALAVLQPAVVEVNVLPAIFFVTVGALPGIVVVGLGVAVQAVAETVMVEISLEPGSRRVAAGALAFIVSEWFAVLMAGQAVAVAGVIELQLQPVLGILVAALAFTRVMIEGHFLRMAGAAFYNLLVVVVGHVPVVGIGMAQGTLAGIMIVWFAADDRETGFPPVGSHRPEFCILVCSRQVVRMAGRALIHVFVVETERDPVGDAVAVGAFTLEVVRVELSRGHHGQILGKLVDMTGAAFDWRIGIDTIGMAVRAFQATVAACERKIRVVDSLPKE
jgi:hypothetical protein